MKLFLLLGTLLCCPIFGQPAKFYQESQNNAAANIDSSQQIADVIVKSKIPVLVDFWAPWCGPCRYVTPIINELEDQFKGKVLFLKVNVDVHKVIAAYFKIMAIPSVYILYDKTVVQNLQGVQPKEAYVQALEDVLKTSREKPVSSTPASPE